MSSGGFQGLNVKILFSLMSVSVRQLILFTMLTLPVLAVGQTSDTTVISTENASISEDSPEVIYHAPPDSTLVKKRAFEEDAVYKLKADADLNYKQPPTVAESLWDRLLTWLGEFIDSFFNAAWNTSWGRVFVYIMGLVLLIVIIMMILKVNAFKVLYSAEGEKLSHQVLDENIHEMNFEELVLQSISAKDYRRGIRLLFLHALKILSDKHLIAWQAGKTNHDYVMELSEKDLKKGLNELSFYFDYAWYGNFNVTADTFNKAQNIFSDWKQKVR